MHDQMTHMGAFTTRICKRNITLQNQTKYQHSLIVTTSITYTLHLFYYFIK
jgi:hypothetical protein